MKATEIRRIGIVGGGYVGHGAAQQFAQSGYPVTLYNRMAESTARAMANIDKGLDFFAEAGLVSQSERDAARACISPTNDLAAAVAGADFVVEAVAKQLPVKQEIFQKLDALAPERAILASETSGLCMTDIARHTAPARSLHYNPQLYPSSPHSCSRGSSGRTNQPGRGRDDLRIAAAHRQGTSRMQGSARPYWRAPHDGAAP